MSAVLSAVGIRYQPDENPPAALSFGFGMQLAVLTVAAPILFPTIVMRVAGAPEPWVAWAVFAAVAISGVTTALQSARISRIGGGHVLVMGSSSAFIGVCITAVAEGGPALLASLVIVSALFQLLLSARLALFRRILTPTVAGTVIMLIPVTVMPYVFGMLEDVPEGSPALAAPLSALATVLVICAISLKAAGTLRLWAPVIGVVAGSLAGGFFGLYDLDRVAAAPWVGFPQTAWPGFDPDFGPAFWALVPAFLLVMTAGGLVAIVMTLFMEFAKPRRSRMETDFGLSALPAIKEFTGTFASRGGWGPAMADRLEAAAEETLLAVMQDDEPARERGGRRLRLVAHREEGAAVLEFIVAPGEENLEDRMALIGGETDETPDERDVSIRLLRHLASSVRHQQYHDIDIVTVRVNPLPSG